MLLKKRSPRKLPPALRNNFFLTNMEPLAGFLLRDVTIFIMYLTYLLLYNAALLHGHLNRLTVFDIRGDVSAIPVLL